MFVPLPGSYLADPLATYPWRMCAIGTPGLELRPAFKCHLRFVTAHSSGQAILASETITEPREPVQAEQLNSQCARYRYCFLRPVPSRLRWLPKGGPRGI
jgi:hypothetical protein